LKEEKEKSRLGFVTPYRKEIFGQVWQDGLDFDVTKTHSAIIKTYYNDPINTLVFHNVSHSFSKAV
jgi:hypothetical protein